MKNRKFTTIAAIVITLILLWFVNKDMNNGASLTDAISGVSGWITTAIMFLIGKDSYVTDILKKDKDDK